MNENNSWAYEILHDLKKQNKRWFIICLIELIMIFLTFGYLVYVLNDVGYEETTNSQEIYGVDTIDNSSIKNGD